MKGPRNEVLVRTWTSKVFACKVVTCKGNVSVNMKLVDPKFLKNMRFAKKHNKKGMKQVQKAEKAVQSK
ncbi:hypothetical protein F7725_016848 [Dissostichus mawsoni]|uniref:60S ribosomal protein L29 n=1 Tax=Dissostichus mawsoni TaxID=36200 RepID=A0A7J5Z2Q6_DISMA|nr:hypothetical protein F7725_016848 [Dissostichus mawsoni]